MAAPCRRRPSASRIPRAAGAGCSADTVSLLAREDHAQIAREKLESTSRSGMDRLRSAQVLLYIELHRRVTPADDRRAGCSVTRTAMAYDVAMQLQQMARHPVVEVQREAGFQLLAQASSGNTRNMGRGGEPLDDRAVDRHEVFRGGQVLLQNARAGTRSITTSERSFTSDRNAERRCGTATISPS